MTTVCRADVIVMGAGMAGASASAFLAKSAKVVLIEREAHVGYHSTGRSAALFTEIYGNETIRALTRASRRFLLDPPLDFAAAPLLKTRQTLYFATHDQGEIATFRSRPDIAAATEVLSASQAVARVPVFRPDAIFGAVLEPDSADMDVDALHQGFLHMARSSGATVHVDSPTLALERYGDNWSVETPQGRFEAPVLVNAAGAWGDEVAKMAGVAPVDLQPKRRTVVLIDAPAGVDSAGWPACIAIDESFYFKPESGLLLLSPADETDTVACDVQPEELDIAVAIDRYEQATGQSVRQVRHRWAGLRVFTADRTPVVGFDPDAPGFFWLVGQGGYGIQTAAAMGRTAAALASGRSIPADVEAEGVEPAALSPARFRR